jgi:hypothetical protein
MTQQAAGYEDCDIALASGTLRVRRWGAAAAPAVVCVPGLSANLRVADIDANHYTITTHDDSIAAIGAFLRTS